MAKTARNEPAKPPGATPRNVARKQVRKDRSEDDFIYETRADEEEGEEINGLYPDIDSDFDGDDE